MSFSDIEERNKIKTEIQYSQAEMKICFIKSIKFTTGLIENSFSFWPLKGFHVTKAMHLRNK